MSARSPCERSDSGFTADSGEMTLKSLRSCELHDLFLKCPLENVRSNH